VSSGLTTIESVSSDTQLLKLVAHSFPPTSHMKVKTFCNGSTAILSGYSSIFDKKQMECAWRNSNSLRKKFLKPKI
jgi:hypothetical protein